MFLLLSFSSYAQIVIDSTDMPDPGDTITRRFTYDLNSLNYQQTDTACTWDFSSLSSDYLVSDSFVTVGSTDFAYEVMFNNFLYPQNRATVALPQESQNIPFIDIEITERYNFYKNTHTRFTMLGIGAKINDIPMPLKYSNPEVLYKFPITYNNRDTSDSEYHANIPGMGYYGQKIHRENHVDGWGTLFLPADTFEVIRVKSKVIYSDTIYSDSLGFGYEFDRTETEYKWFAKGFHGPVLQITKQEYGLASAKFYYNPPPDLSIKQTETEEIIKINPNPANDFIHIYFPNSPDDFSIIITDITGREKVCYDYQQNQQNLNISVAKLTKGLYFLSIVTPDIKLTKKFIKL